MGGADEFTPDNRDSPFFLRATRDASPNGQITEATANNMLDTQQANAAHTALEHQSSNNSDFPVVGNAERSDGGRRLRLVFGQSQA